MNNNRYVNTRIDRVLAQSSDKPTDTESADAAEQQVPDTSAETLSTEEIQRQMREIRAASESESEESPSLVQGVLEEVQLIEWPRFTNALLNTALVIVLVLGTSLVLFGVNTALSEISRQIYHAS